MTPTGSFSLYCEGFSPDENRGAWEGDFYRKIRENHRGLRAVFDPISRNVAEYLNAENRALREESGVAKPAVLRFAVLLEMLRKVRHIER